MNADDLTGLTITAAAGLIRSGQLSPLELVEAYLERIAAYDPLLNCFITLTAESALQEARAAEKALQRKEPAGPLCGIPLALKDLYETRGVLTTAGSSFFRDYVPEADAVAVTRLRQAGAILLGKLNMHEIALGVTNVNPHFGACRNPWAPERVTGGSSGGSAAALAAGLCLGSLGSDTGGSIRIPASLCGVVGFKPTRGRVSLRGVIPLSWNMDHAGPLARSVLDAALLLRKVAGYDSEDPFSDPTAQGEIPMPSGQVTGWRIAVASDDYFTVSDPEVWAALQAAAQVFRALGAQVEAVEFPEARRAAEANGLMVTSDAAAFHRERLQAHPDGFGADVLQRLQFGAALTSGEYVLARHTQAVLHHSFTRFFDRYDVLLTPTTPVAAPPIEGPDAVEQARWLTRFTAPFNLTGLPALSLPCGFTTNGLPIGLQIIARPWDEAKVLQAAYAYEQATPWHTQEPSATLWTTH